MLPFLYYLLRRLAPGRSQPESDTQGFGEDVADCKTGSNSRCRLVLPSPSCSLSRVLVQTSELAWAATMTGMPARQRTPELFKGLHFDHEVVILCVRWYLSYKLSSRDLVNMMGERSVELAHTTILRWYGGTSQGLKSAGTDTHEQPAGHDAATRRI